MKIDNNTMAIFFIGVALVIGTLTRQTEVVTGALGALAGFVTSKAIDRLE